MYRDEPYLDSYQNLICSPDTNESVETISAQDRSEGVESPIDGIRDEVISIYATEGFWDNDEQAERVAADLSTNRAEGNPKRRTPSEHERRDGNDPGYARADEGSVITGAEHGRASSGESFEDEEDEVFYRSRRRR